MECCVTVVEFNYEYLSRIKANVDGRRSIMRVAYTKMIFCLKPQRGAKDYMQSE